MRVATITRSGSFPTQFTGETYGGWFFYGHYRHGVLSIGASQISIDDATSTSFEVRNDKTGDGIMEIEQFLAIVRERRIAPLWSPE